MGAPFSEYTMRRAEVQIDSRRGESVDRRQLENLILDLSHTFSSLPADAVALQIGTALERVAAVLSCDAAIFIVLQPNSAKNLRFAWTSQSADDLSTSLLEADLPWSTQQLIQGQGVEFSTVVDLPPEAAGDLTVYQHQGVRSLCAVPISVGGRLEGVTCVATHSRELAVPRWLASALRSVGEVLCGALHRARAAETSLDIDDLMTLMPAAATFGIWELADNVVRIDNAARALLHLHSLVTDLPGLLSSVHAEDRDDVRRAIAAAVAGHSVLDLRYRVISPDGCVSWVAARGRIDLGSPGGSARLRTVLIDVTEARRAQAELEELRNDLSHLNRLAMLSFLSGSFAHELKQPLTAILSNAQAGLRFLKATFVDRDELQEILADIVKEDERAGEVIRRLQALFLRGESVRRLVNLNEATQEVLGLLHSDLVGRSVVVAVALDQRLPVLSGDRVQLQQVLLNLVVNACEAMADNPADDRTLMIRTERMGADTVRLSVRDNGRGIAPENVERVFEPFFTTKPGGTGLGLVICRKIVGAHNGKLWAVNNAAAGATFSLELPAQA
jgi:signal transduction histidine kinase